MHCYTPLFRNLKAAHSSIQSFRNRSFFAFSSLIWCSLLIFLNRATFCQPCKIHRQVKDRKSGSVYHSYINGFHKTVTELLHRKYHVCSCFFPVGDVLQRFTQPFSLPLFIRRHGFTNFPPPGSGFPLNSRRCLPPNVPCSPKDVVVRGGGGGEGFVVPTALSLGASNSMVKSRDVSQSKSFSDPHWNSPILEGRDFFVRPKAWAVD